MNNDEIKQLLCEIKTQIEYSARVGVSKVILFGSHAIGNADKESDYDILVILDNDYDWKLENRILDICFEIDLRYGIVSDIKVISSNELGQPRGHQAYIVNAIKNGISA